MRTATVALMAGAASSLTASCDGGPGFGTDIELTNGCAETIAVRLDDVASPGPEGSTARERYLLEPESSRTQLVSADAPKVYLWVAGRGDATWGEPSGFDVATLLAATGADGRAAKSLLIEGSVCPSD